MPGRVNINASSGGASKAKAKKSGQKLSVGQSQRNLTAKKKAVPPKLNATQQAELEARLATKPEASGAAVNIQKHVRGRLAANRVEAIQANQQPPRYTSRGGGASGRSSTLNVIFLSSLIHFNETLSRRWLIFRKSC
jgi:beta-lactam-binding protein with PASTA domain